MAAHRRLAYSTDVSPVARRQAGAAPPAASARPGAPDDGVIRLFLERRRAGSMTLVTGLSHEELPDIAKTLKKICGTGGTAKEGVVQIQGDHREIILAWFLAQGRRAKRAGG
ncbi:MAG: hypothetical protein ACYDHD_01760 [Vulcanimicrobiaceae bacterium]